jgi:DNA-binding MarR family transcriptional regulator
MDQEQPPRSSTSHTDATDITTIARALDHCSMLLGRQFGLLSRPQRRLLLVLADRDPSSEPLRVSDLADHLGLSAAGATRMLDTLEGLGYLTRYRPSHTDQRQVYVQLTPTGMEALQRANEVLEQRLSEMVLRLTATERTTLARLLHKLAHAANAAMTQEPAQE